MAEKTFEAFTEAALRQVCAGLDLPYEVATADYRGTQARMDAALSEIEKAEQRRALIASFDAAQDLAHARAAALSPDRVTYAPGSTDKRRARELRRRIESGRPFTPRQVELAAYLAWRYRRQVPESLVPAAPVEEP